MRSTKSERMARQKEPGILSQNKTAVFICGALLLLLLWQVFSAYHTLPEQVPAHFSFSGQPNRWMSRNLFLILELVLIFFSGGSFCFLPLFFEKIPLGYINLPNKEYWFTPERKRETFVRISAYLLWFGNATLLFFYFLFGKIVAFAENTNRSLKLWPELLVYLLFVLIWSVRFFQEFSKRNRQKIG